MDHEARDRTDGADGDQFCAVARHRLTQVSPAIAEDPPGMLRGSGLEIVDAQGRVRASISILPGSGEESETALFRLINADGQPSVKLAASLTGAGLSLVGGDDASWTPAKTVLMNPGML